MLDAISFKLQSIFAYKYLYAVQKVRATISSIKFVPSLQQGAVLEDVSALHEQRHDHSNARQPRQTPEVGTYSGGMVEVDDVIDHPADNVAAREDVQGLRRETGEVASKNRSGEKTDVLETIRGCALSTGN
jgi:hypothetical protein